MTPADFIKCKLSAKGGFTLLELMITLTLMSMIVLITAGALRLGTRSAESGQKKIEAIERFRTSLNIIESQVESAMLINPNKPGKTADLDFTQFKGDHSSFQIRSLYSIWGGGKGPVLASYDVKTNNNGSKALYVAESPIIIPDVSMKALLIDGATDIYFEYYYKGPTDEKGNWIEEWTEKDSVPRRMRITIKKDNKILPLIIPMKLGGKYTQAGTSEEVPNP